jgi:hypothetical protein
MLFMVIEHFRPGQAREIYRRFGEKGRMAPEHVRYISSWVDLAFQSRRKLLQPWHRSLKVRGNPEVQRQVGEKIRAVLPGP